MMQTYILTDGKTENLERRLKEHAKGRWRLMVLALVFEGNYEKEVKRAGVEFIFHLCLHQK